MKSMLYDTSPYTVLVFSTNEKEVLYIISVCSSPVHISLQFEFDLVEVFWPAGIYGHLQGQKTIRI